LNFQFTANIFLCYDVIIVFLGLGGSGQSGVYWIRWADTLITLIGWHQSIRFHVWAAVLSTA